MRPPPIPPAPCLKANVPIVCGSLGDGDNEKRPPRKGDQCKCEDGWTGINCNVCTEDKACNALMSTGDGGVCYQNGEVIKHNYQICDVTNKEIRRLLGEKRPQATFTCKAEDQNCDFQCMSSLPSHL